MTDSTLSAAVAEAYASAPLGVVTWETIEIWHPAFSAPIRVVRDGASLTARIEASALRDAGQVVTFTPYAFDLVPPDQSSTAIPQATLTIDNISREIGQQLDMAILDGRPTEVIWRTYLSGNELVGPEHLPPVRMQLIVTSLGVSEVRATIGFRDLMNASFPALEYDTETFPGLIP